MKGTEEKSRRLSVEEEREVTSRSFRAYGIPMDMATSLKYLGQVISAAVDDWPAVVKNMSKARAVWQRLTGIISREGAAPRVSGFFSKDMVQSMSLLGAETWVITPLMGRILGGVPRPGGSTIDREYPAAADRR